MATKTPPYLPAADRYQYLPYRQVGASGLKLPVISLGLWQNFGDETPLGTQRAIIRRAFDRGVTHFDLANNYGPPNGAAEKNFGRIMAEDLSGYRDEIVISSKAGWYMHEGPYGVGGSRKYLRSSIDRTLTALGVDYVDIFYHHRPDPDTPLEETMYALRDIVASGKALYVGISSYGPELTGQAARIMAEEGCPILIHQPSYSILNRWVEAKNELGPDGYSTLDICRDEGIGVIAFSVLAQGLLSSRYLHGIPDGSRGARGETLTDRMLSDDNLDAVHELDRIARDRGQTLAQMAIAWVLRRSEVSSALIGASSVEQLDENLDAVNNLHFEKAEIRAIDAIVSRLGESGVNMWGGATASKLRERSSRHALD